MLLTMAAVSEAGLVTLMRPLPLPMAPLVPPRMKLTVAPEPAVRVTLSSVRSAEFTPVPPGDTVTADAPEFTVRAPRVSVEAV